MSSTYIAPIDDLGAVRCASCEANWSVPMLAEAHSKSRLRAMGFAFVWFGDGAIGINGCPHCELPINDILEAPWPSLPLFP